MTSKRPAVSGGGVWRERRYAALDLGTNNCRLLVAQPAGRGFRVVDAFSRIVRLGEGVGITGRLSDKAMERAIEALHVCAEKIHRNHAWRNRAIATEACRCAANGAEFIARVKRETGLDLEVISPEDEARLAVAGCAPLLDPTADHLLVFDIGGGSTELIWINLTGTPAARRESLLVALSPGRSRADRFSDRARAAAAHITDWISLPIGVATLAEKFGRIHDEHEKFAAMTGHVAKLILPFARGDCAATPEKLTGLQLLGTSGTITTLAGVHLELARYERAKVDGLWISIEAIEQVIDRLLEMNLYERAQMPCIGDDRAELVISGAAILRSILRTWPSPRLRVADRGLREGLLYGLMHNTRVGRRPARKQGA